MPRLAECFGGGCQGLWPSIWAPPVRLAMGALGQSNRFLCPWWAHPLGAASRDSAKGPFPLSFCLCSLDASSYYSSVSRWGRAWQSVWVIVGSSTSSCPACGSVSFLSSFFFFFLLLMPESHWCQPSLVTSLSADRVLISGTFLRAGQWRRKRGQRRVECLWVVSPPAEATEDETLWFCTSAGLREPPITMVIKLFGAEAVIGEETLLH